MGVMDRYDERKKKKDEKTTGGKSTPGGVAERYERNQYYQTLDTDRVDEKYLNTFVSDTNSFFRGVNENSIPYDAAKSTLGDLSTRYDTIQGWLYKNRSKLKEEAYTSLTSTFDGLKSSFDGLKDFYSQWESEDAYNAAVKNADSRNKASQMTVEDLRVKVAGVNDAKNDLELIQSVNLSYVPIGGYGEKATPDEQKRYEDYRSKLTTLWEKYGKDQYDTVEDFYYGEFYTDAGHRVIRAAEEAAKGVAYTDETGKNVVWQDLYDVSVAEKDLEDKYKKYSAEADWAEKSQKIQNVDDTVSDLQIVDGLIRTLVPYDRERAIANGIEEATYEDIEKKRQYISEKYGIDFTAGPYSSNERLGELYTKLDGQPGEYDTFDKFSYLSDDEREVLSYIYATQGRAAALGWYNSREKFLDERYKTYLNRGFAGAGEHHPVLGSALSVALSLGSGAEYLTDLFQSAATGEEQYNSLAQASSSIRSGVMEKVDVEIGNWDAFDFVYSTAMSGVDSLAAGTVLGNYGGVVLGLSAAAQATNDALDRGMSNGQAFWNGIAAGVFEGLFETVSIGNFSALKEIASASGKEIALNIAKSMLVNASEETLTEIANIVYDTIVNGDFSQYETVVRQYVASGMTESEAKKKAALDLGAQVAESGASGALMGLGFGAAGSTRAIANNTIGTAIRDYQAGNNILNTEGGVDALTALANQMYGVDSPKVSRQLQQLTEKPSALKAGRLLRNINNTAAEQTRQNLVSKLTEKGIEAKEAKKIAQAVMTLRTDYSSLTQEQLDLLDSAEKDNRIAAAVREVMAAVGASALQIEEGQENADPDVAAEQLTQIAQQAAENANPVAGNEKTLEDLAASMVAESQDGKLVAGETFRRSSGAVVKVKKFTDFTGGKATVELEDGTTAPAADISFAGGEDGLFHLVATEENMTAPAANAIWRLWQSIKSNNLPVSAEQYSAAALAAYRAGLRGDSTILNENDNRAAALSRNQRELIYDTGRRAAQAKADAQQANVDKVYAQANAALQQSGAAQKGTYRAVAVDGLTVNKMTRQQKAAYEMASLIAPGVKGNIELYDGGKEWGYYDHKTDTIRLNINAKWNQTTMLAFTLGHELAHRAKMGSPAKFKAFADFLIKEYGKQGTQLNELIGEQLKAADEYDKTVPKNKRLNMTEEQAFEEVVADACQRMLLDTDAGQKLAEFGTKSRENRSILQNVKKWIREFMDRVSRAFKNVMPDSAAAREFARFDQQTKQILADMFVDMTVDAGEKLSTIKAAGMTEKITTGEGGVRFMTRGGMEVMSFSIPKGAKVNADLYIEDRLGVLLEDIRKHLPDLRSMDPVYELDGTEFQKNQSDIRSLKRKVKDFFNSIGNKVERKELGIIALNNAGVHDSLEHGYGPIKAACFAALPSVIEKGLMFGPNQYMDRSYDTYLFVAPVRFAGTEKGEFYVGAYVIRDVNTTRYKIHEVLTINKEGNRPFKPEADQNGERLRDDSLPSPRITQQEREVKEKDAEGAMPHKIPVSRDVADRGKLLDLVEQLVTNSNEYKVLKNYRNHIQEMLALEEQIERLGAEIHRISFAEGPRDMEYLNKLKLLQKQAMNRLNYYDNRRLSMEKSGVLKDMLARYRKQIAQASNERVASAKNYYQERNERRENEIRQYYRESRRQAVERHDMAEIRQRIRKDVQRLDSLLNKGNKKNNVKEGLQEFVGAALRLAKGAFLKDYNEYDMIRAGLKNDLLADEKVVFDRCRELLQELDSIRDEKNAEPGADSIHGKWDPEQVMRRDDREEALKRELSQNMRVLRDRNVFQREREGAENAKAEALADELLTAYQKLAETEYEHLQGTYSDKVYDQIDTVKKQLSGKAIKDMTSVELRELQKLYRMIRETVNRADELFGAYRNQKTSERGNRLQDQLQTERDADITTAAAKLKDFGWSLLTPEAAAAVIGAPELTKAVREIMAGEIIQQQDLEHAKQYLAEQVEKFNRKKWNTSRQVKFAGTEITIGQAMALFAYTEREAGRNHISGDGFTHSKDVPIKEKKGKLKLSKKFIKDTTKAYRVTEDMYDELGRLLTEEQKGYARALRDYLAEVMGAKGNEVSMELYGIEMYGEKYYFPLKTAKKFMDAALGAKHGEVKVTNQGFTKALQEGAENAIVLEDLEAVFSKHVQEMSTYHALGVAMENFNRLYNYRRTEQRQTTDAWGQTVTEEVKSSEPTSLYIERRAVGGSGYLTKWLENVNGGVRSDATEQLLGGLLGNFRKTAVLGNLSVIVQQPTAILRAVPYLGKDFCAGWLTFKRTTPNEGLVREMYRYCPVAGLKKAGGFDPSAGRTVRQYLFDGRDDGKNKLRKARDGFNAVLGMPPEKADELAWSYLWLSCKKKLLRQNPSLRAGSKEHCQASAELFTQIVRETQVYDSVMSKPLIMQSKLMTVKSLTSFMNEPLKGMNQCITAIARAKNGEISGLKAAENVLWVGVSNLLARTISALIYALRDDDDEKTYWEKYTREFVGGLTDWINPFNSVPGIKEFFSIAQGYGSERAEFAIISDVLTGSKKSFTGIQKLIEESDTLTPEETETTIWDTLEIGLGNVLNGFGVPGRNLIREFRGIYYLIKQWGDVKETDAGLRYAALEGLTGKATSKAKQIENAVAEDDTEHLLRVMGTYEEAKDAVSELVSATREAWLSGRITDDRAMEYLQEYGGKSLEQTADYISEWEFKKEHPESEIKDSKAVNYIQIAEPAGISLDIYSRFVERTGTGAKKEKVLTVIDSLPISDKQKDALYLSKGYAESNLEDAPWN